MSLSACTDRRSDSFVVTMDSLYQHKPYAAIDSIDSFIRLDQRMSRRNRMVLSLYKLRAQNSAGVSFTSDSLARLVVDYFNDHGNVNERVSAYYVLGSVYRDLDNYPEALNMYRDAILVLNGDLRVVDYKLIYRIYGQIGDILYKQLAYNEARDVYTKAEQIAYNHGDTLWALLAHEQVCKILSLQNKVEASYQEREYLYIEYKRLGYKDLAVKCRLPNVKFMISKGRLVDAYKVLTDYRRFSGDVDSHENVAKGCEYYYRLLGIYYANVNEYVKSSVFFHKCLALTDNFSEREQCLNGLADLYKKQNMVDSVAKYAEMSRIANDSLFMNMSTENMQKMQAAYNYKSVEQGKVHALMQLKYARFIMAIAFIIVVLLVVLFRTLSYNKKTKLKMNWLIRQKKMDELAMTCERKTSEIEMLKKVNAELKILTQNKDTEILRLISEKRDLVASLERKINNENLNSKIAANSNEITVDIVDKFREMANGKHGKPSFKDWTLLDKYVVVYHYQVYLLQKVLSNSEYNVSVLIKLGFRPSEICNLMGLSLSNVSNIRKRLYKKLIQKTGSAKDFDEYVKSLV